MIDLLYGIPIETLIQLRKQIYGLIGREVGSYKRDESLPLAEQYAQLEAHHIKETEFLINLLIKWGNQVQGLDKMLAEEQKKNDLPT
jgi:hypothetical protein